MSSDVAVRVEGLGKDYILGERVAGYATLRETVASLAAGAFRRKGDRRAEPEVVQALDGLTFAIDTGESVGFIGNNGAGKTTLLKVLSRITEPTRGWGEIRGRVGSLLEVGTGFHPELTGRENIFLNGVILGMRKREIERRFDEIAAFSEIGRFLDTPVKRYSTGMTVRLAFAVAAHLDPEVLIVDEVLAVGDAPFQRRCLDRMSQIAQDGRTVLFVSHNMAIIRGLCRRGIVLDHGKVIADAGIDSAVATYLGTLEDAHTTPLAERLDRQGTGEIKATSVTVRGPHGVPTSGEPVTIEITFDEPRSDVTCEFTIYDQFGLPVASVDSGNLADADRFDGRGDAFLCEIDELPFVPGRYRIDLSLRDSRRWQDSVHGAAFFDVEQGRLGGRAVMADSPGDIALRHRWTNPAR